MNLMLALERWREATFHESHKLFVGPQAIMTNRTIKLIANACGELPEMEDLRQMKQIRPDYHAEVHKIIKACVGPFDLRSPPKRAKATSQKRSRPYQNLSQPKRRALEELNT